MNTNTPGAADALTDERLFNLADECGASTISQNMAGEQIIKFRIGELREFIAALSAPASVAGAPSETVAKMKHNPIYPDEDREEQVRHARYVDGWNACHAAIVQAFAAPSAAAPSAGTLTNEQLADAAYKGFDDYWVEDCPGREREAWLASAKAVLALAAPSAAAPSAAIDAREQGAPPCSLTTPVLDACCGSRMFWFDRKDARATFVDVRRESHRLTDSSSTGGYRDLIVDPDHIADFTNLPFAEGSFSHVVFDPPHFERNGDKGWVGLKYGTLKGDWREMLRAGFAECFRVLRSEGTLIFKWCSDEIPLSQILALTPEKPLYGHRSGKQAKTHWVAFLKGGALASRSEAPAPSAATGAIDAREQEDIEPQPHHPGRWIDKQNPGWSFPSKEAAFAARGQEATNTARLEWLHMSNKDAEGYEYGVCKVKFDAAGKLQSFLWTASDSSDVDAAIAAAGSVA